MAPKTTRVFVNPEFIKAEEIVLGVILETFNNGTIGTAPIMAPPG